MTECLRNEEGQVHRATNTVQRAWMANLAVPSRGGLPGFSGTISVVNTELPWNSGKTTQSCCESARRVCRESLQLVMVEKRPRELEAIH